MSHENLFNAAREKDLGPGWHDPAWRARPIGFKPTERELQAFRRNLAEHPKITDEWLAGYLADPTWSHPDYHQAVKDEIERRKNPTATEQEP